MKRLLIILCLGLSLLASAETGSEPREFLFGFTGSGKGGSISMEPVPEPATFWLMAAVLGGFLAPRKARVAPQPPVRAALTGRVAYLIIVIV